jgi:hypothetical protein
VVQCGRIGRAGLRCVCLSGVFFFPTAATPSAPCL